MNLSAKVLKSVKKTKQRLDLCKSSTIVAHSTWMRSPLPPTMCASGTTPRPQAAIELTSQSSQKCCKSVVANLANVAVVNGRISRLRIRPICHSPGPDAMGSSTVSWVVVEALSKISTLQDVPWPPAVVAQRRRRSRTVTPRQKLTERVSRSTARATRGTSGSDSREITFAATATAAAAGAIPTAGEW